jgi:hypothetical protein
VAGAQVHLEFDGKSVPLADKGGGNYETTNSESTDLVYTQGSTYRFVVVNAGSTFAENVQAPEREQIKEFHQGLLDPNYDAGSPFQYPDGGFEIPDAGAYLYPDGGLAADIPGFIYVTPGQSLTLTRPANTGDRNIALTAVVPLDDQSHQPGQPTFTSPDTSPLSLLGLLVNPGPYKQATITVDGAKAWAACSPQDYLVTVTSVKKGTTEGNNLAIGASLIFAGSADAAPVRCKTP